MNILPPTTKAVECDARDVLSALFWRNVDVDFTRIVVHAVAGVSAMNCIQLAGNTLR